MSAPPSALTRRRLLGSGLGIAAGASLGLGGWWYARDPATPLYIAEGSANVRQSYAYAAAHPEVLRYMPCFCGCGQQNGHRSVLDCFVTGHDLLGRPAYNPHGAGCAICTGVVIAARDRLAAGKSLRQTRQEVDEFFAAYAAYATDTPRPE
jgi:hypothetical protein